MRLLYLNPNATEAMTDSVVSVARAALPEAEVLGWTNASGPPAIQGPEDGEMAVAGLMAMLPAARKAQVDVIVIACFDDTGLALLQTAAHCPVIGIGQAAYHTAALLGHRFSVVTTLAVSVPVIAGNIADSGFAPLCSKVRPSGLGVLEVDKANPATRARLSAEIDAAQHEDNVTAVILGCAGMAQLAADLQSHTSLRLIDGVYASARLALALYKTHP
ncbi:MAG: aspartate/glutamate racemase family protein [Rhodobacteraceae bacterium]|jgi:allantoin racemase|nr:aspartate/glutamate racemase family protein [Paracoccaceae bacterium]